jgi:AraC-like DNA-binding protein
MRMNTLEIANSVPIRRGPPLGRLWPRVIPCGPALPPTFLGVNSCTDQDLVVAESVLQSRLELLNMGDDGGDHLAYFCIYMADQATWLEPEAGGIQQIAPHDIALINSEAPLRTVSTTGTRHLSVFVPRSMVLAGMAWADQICARTIRLDCDSRSTAHSLIAALRSSIRLDCFDSVGPSLVQALLALLRTVGTEAAPARARPIATIRREQVAECIKRHFPEFGLTVAKIAEELKVSVRYLQRICEGGPSPGEQLRQFRLRKAAERLRNSTWITRSISEICYSCGFGSSSHFSTEFRRFYGVTPTEYRLESGPRPESPGEAGP